MIEQEDIQRLKEIFVTRQECDGKNSEIIESMNTMKVDLAVIKDNQETQKWLSRLILGAILTAIVGGLIAILTGGIL